MDIQRGESPNKKTSVPLINGPCKPNDSSAEHLPLAVLKVSATVGCDSTDFSTFNGMPDLAIDLRLPNALEAPESLVHSSQYPEGDEVTLASLPLISNGIESKSDEVVRL